MAVRRLSRYQFSNIRLDPQGRTFLTERHPYRYTDIPDTIQYVVGEGDSLRALAVKYYGALPRPERLWEVIADFQPDPIHDPTLKLDAGRLLFIPSLRTVTEVIYNERRRKFL
mgnify:CR=1 FL=1